MFYRPTWRDLWRLFTWSPPALDGDLTTRLALRDLDAALSLLASPAPSIKEVRAHIVRAIETLERKR